ncbi:hypothetical protein Ccrd_026082, partial [Cynara cardunculus var. scolymus]
MLKRLFVNISGCSKVDELPEFFGMIQTLREFCVDGTAITEFPSFVFSQSNLQLLEFGRHEENQSRWWTSISHHSWLPSKMPSLTELLLLRKLNFSHCKMIWVQETGTEAVEVLHLLVKEYCLKVHIDGKAFAQMKNLRILKICDEELRHRRHAFDWKLWKESKVNYDGKLKFLSNKLSLLYWHGFPFKCFPSDFYPENIVAIDLSYSHIKNLWTSPKSWISSGWQEAKNFFYFSVEHGDDVE